MSENLRALVVVLVLAGCVFALAKRPAGAVVDASDFARRRNAWLGLTAVAYLSHSFWLYVVVGALYLAFVAHRESNRVALYLMVLFAVPAASAQIPGFGVMNYLFALDHPRLLALVILLPAFVALVPRPDTVRFGRTAPDKALAIYLLLSVALELRSTSATDTLRQAFNLAVDVFLPYFVVSRSLRTVADFKQTLLAFVMAAMAMAAIGTFEAARHWLLYKSLVSAMGLDWSYAAYLGRVGTLRAQASTGQPIALGYVVAVAIGFFLVLQRSVANAAGRWLGWALLAAGLIAPLSRGPWVGAALLFVVFAATGPFAARRLATAASIGFAALPALRLFPGGEEVLDLLPFVGTVESANISYREKLIDTTLAVIDQHPWFGSVDFARTPEMQAMIQGQGIIDVVNTYLLIALQIGYVGVALFAGFFALVCRGVFSGLRRLPDAGSEDRLLGRALLATLIAILVIIFTVSPITIIPIVYWVVAGMGVAYAQMVRPPAQQPIAEPSIAPFSWHLRDQHRTAAPAEPARIGRVVPRLGERS